MSRAEEIDDEIISLSLFRQYLELIDIMKDSLWIDTRSQIVKYIQLRQIANLSWDVKGDTIHIHCSDLSLEHLKDTPVSFYLNIPEAWVENNFVVQDDESHRGMIIKLDRNLFIGEIKSGQSLSIFCYCDEQVSTL